MIVLINLNGSVCELAKNLILSGINICMCDITTVNENDIE
jgi:hypothetical protein